MATWLTRTQVTGTNRKLCTISMWIKKVENAAGHEQYLFHSWADGNNRFMIALQNDDTLQVRERSGGNTTLQIDTNRKFRDPNSWYHIVVRVDTTQSTAADRIRIYVNGVQETSFSGASYPSQNLDLRIGTADYTFYLGQYGGGGNNFSGVASHWHFADGQSLAPTVFGETDSTTGEWKINTDPTVSYGNNGFFLFKDDNSVNDDSGEGHNFTLASGTLTKTEDNPSNVFATMNSLNKENGGSTLSLGNTKLVTTAQGGGPYTGRTIATLGATSGKYYWEVKPTTTVSSTYPVASVVGEDFIVMSGNNYLSGGSGSQSYITFKMEAGSIATNFTGSRVDTSYGNAVSANDVVGVALDLDNGKIFFSINGTWQNSGDPVNGTNPASSSVGSLGGDFVFPAFGDENYSSSATLLTNFGNGYFGTTAVSSAGTNASGIGIFEYDVPTGFTALCTKGLNE